jgi:hypothetical protein
MGWIEEYLAYRGDIMQKEVEVEVVYNMVQQSMLCAHLLLAVWAVIQAESSGFDFGDYAL